MRGAIPLSRDAGSDTTVADRSVSFPSPRDAAGGSNPLKRRGRFAMAKKAKKVKKAVKTAKKVKKVAKKVSRKK
jgi:hypothetical protein